jgi:glycosyltransferase involved in cell wall biosynthesis
LLKIKPDVVIVNCELPELYIAFTPQRIKRLICVEHTSQPWSGRRALGTFIRFVLARRKALWVTVNSQQKGIWPTGIASIFIANPVVVPKTVSTENNQSKFVFIGRLRKEKGIQFILNTIERVGEHISVFGSGNLQSELKSRFGNSATFHGFVENPWANIHLNQTIIIASEYEGDGMVVVEAILAGSPMILKNNEDLRRFNLPDSNYFNSLDELESKLVLAANNPEPFRPKSEIKLHYLNERDPSSIVKRWVSLLS